MKPDDGQLAEVLQHARALLGEHSTAGFAVVTYEDEVTGETRYAFEQWGNEFARQALAEKWAEGALTDEDEDETDDDDEEHGHGVGLEDDDDDD